MVMGGVLLIFRVNFSFIFSSQAKGERIDFCPYSGMVVTEEKAI